MGLGASEWSISAENLFLLAVERRYVPKNYEICPLSCEQVHTSNFNNCTGKPRELNLNTDFHFKCAGSIRCNSCEPLTMNTSFSSFLCFNSRINRGNTLCNI